MYCITVSVNYSNILDIILLQNHKFFTKWYIVTQESDQATIDVINKYHFENIEILYFDFTKDDKFNKGGGVNYALSLVPEGASVVLNDSDIYIPDEFITHAELQPEPDTLYSFKRYDYYSYDNFKNDNHDSVYKLNFMGFFQWFKNDKKYTYQNSDSCRGCDAIFSYKFKTKTLLPGIVKHLGRDNVNHFGRKDLNDFIMD